MFTALSRLSKAQDSSVSWADRIKLLQDLGGPKVLLPRIAAAAAGGHPRPPPAHHRRDALQEARRELDLAPL